MTFLERIPWEQREGLVVFDYETSGLHPDDGAAPSSLGLKWGPDREQQIAIPIDQGVLDKPGAQPTLFGDAPNTNLDHWIKVHHWMAKQRLIAHNAKADLWFAWAGLRGIRSVRFDLGGAFHWDTMIIEALLNPGQRISLELVAEREGWNAPYVSSDEQMKSWVAKNRLGGQKRYDLAPWDLLKPYLYGDLERTWMLYHRQREQVAEGLIPKQLVERELQLVRCLFDMERRGLPYNVKDSLQAAMRMHQEITQIENNLPFNPHTKQEVIEWLRSHSRGLNRTESGAWGVDQTIIAAAVNDSVPHAAAYQRWSKLQTAHSLWYTGWAVKAGDDGRVRADYRQVKTWEGNKSSGAVSGRFAVSRVNVQAIPSARQIPDGYPTMQTLIASKPPKTLYEADISQAEMRVAAVLSGCRSMLDGFEKGFDAHDSTTQLIWGIDKSHRDWNERRQVAKRLGFGVIYGAGIRTLADQIRLFTGQDLGEEGVRELWDQYRAAFPEFFRYSRSVKHLVETRGYLVLPGGKLRVFHQFEPTHKAFNAMIQGSVAVGMTEAMLRIEREIPGVMIGQVHDSIMFETDHGYDPEHVAEIISTTFEEWFPGCPFPTEVKPYADK